jgi:hypothetical protein
MSKRVGFDELLRILLEIIPEDEVDLRNDLSKVTKDWWNVAPELRVNSEYFVPFIPVLSAHISIFDMEWKVKVRDTFNEIAKREVPP